MHAMNGMNIVSTGSGTRSAWGVICDNPPAVGGKTPQANADFPEGVDKRKRLFGRFFRENCNRLIREKSVSSGLAHGFPPIGQFAFERSGTRFCFFDKLGNVGIGSTVHVLPRNDKQVGYAVTVDGDFPGEGQLIADGTAMNVLQLMEICPHKGDSESVFGGRLPLSPGQIMSGLTELQFRYVCQCLAHAGTVILSAFSRPVNSAGISEILAFICWQAAGVKRRTGSGRIGKYSGRNGKRIGGWGRKQ